MSSLRNVFIEKMNLAAGHDKAAFEMSLINDYGALPMIIDQTAVPIAYTLQLPRHCNLRKLTSASVTSKLPLSGKFPSTDII